MASRPCTLEDLDLSSHATSRGSVCAAAWRGRRVLVTGDTGFKGGWLVAWLRALGAEVTGYALPPHTRPSFFVATGLGRQYQHVDGDVRDASAVTNAMEKADPQVVFHLAAQPLVRESYVDPIGTYATNVMGTVHLLEAARRARSLRAMVVVTTDKCYENREWPWGYRELDALGGYDPYSSSKASVELVVQAYRQSYFSPSLNSDHGLNLSSARAGNVIGGGDWSDDRLIPDAVRAFESDSILYVRSPEALRPWQYVLEPLRGYLVLAQAGLSGDVGSARAFNFGPVDAETVPVAQLLDRFIAAYDRRGRWELAPDAASQPHEAGLLKLDCSLARERLGWRPLTTLGHCLRTTATWYRAFYGDADPDALLKLTQAQIAEYGQEQP